MIKRLFKTIFILSCCISIYCPTYATKVSDGSAFVTKAEFAADLNSLSSRMSQLENALDAKINSLVSSYLTRNGVWNGAKQTVLNNLGTTPSSAENMRVFNDISKSGLMLVTYYIDINYAVGICKGNDGGKTGISLFAAYGSPVAYTLSVQASLYNADTNVNYQVANVLYSMTGEYDTGNSMVYALSLVTKPSGLFSFFVKKGDNINYSLNTQLNGRMDWWNMSLSSPITGNEKVLSGKSLQHATENRYANWIDGSGYTIKFGIEGNEVEVW